jgi:alpha-L-fucosidase 2
MHYKITWIILYMIIGAAQFISSFGYSQQIKKQKMHFDSLAKSWDESIPLGNGMLGALIWQKDNRLRFSLDRADLWDLRPIKEFQKKEFSCQYVFENVKNNNYAPIHEMIDIPYDNNPAPSKIPAGALEFDISGFGEVEKVDLDLEKALCSIKWKNGIKLETFIHALEPIGWFRFTGLENIIIPEIIPPDYSGKFEQKKIDISHSGQDLASLGYPEPKITKNTNSISYCQKGWGDFSFEIFVKWKYLYGSTLEGVWSITSKGGSYSSNDNAQKIVNGVINKTFSDNLKDHSKWWKSFWERSSISIPDPVLESQWYKELYKFGSSSRRGAPPITLQAIWTADNGKLPPWKGDYHNDLNTQLSYWPCYSSNHLEEGLSFLEWLWKIKPECEKFTREYFGVQGLNVPGVATLLGEPMGGWGQYSLSLTTSAWLAHHFYLHWVYSMDKNFLKNRTYPWLKEVAIFLDNISIKAENGKRKLPLSSSPEINDNRLDAWFPETTNFDLSLIHWLYKTCIDLSEELRYEKDKIKWTKILSEWSELSFAEGDNRLLIAPDYPLPYSHRHFSHLMSIYPLGLFDWNESELNRKIISSSLKELELKGTSFWVGYSFSWLGSLYARAHNGDKAAESLKTFAECFCLPNSFHVNGDQSGKGKSTFTYRPFTLEGNFAFASGVQEMLLQSHNGVIQIFPAIPSDWKEVSFSGLRAEGAFLVSAKMEKGELNEVKIVSGKGGDLKLANPFLGSHFKINGKIPTHEQDAKIISIPTFKGEKLLLQKK